MDKIFSFVRVSDNEPIAIPASNRQAAFAILGYQEGKRLSSEPNGDPEYFYAEVRGPNAWCRHTEPVFLA